MPSIKRTFKTSQKIINGVQDKGNALISKIFLMAGTVMVIIKKITAIIILKFNFLFEKLG